MATRTTVAMAVATSLAALGACTAPAQTPQVAPPHTLTASAAAETVARPELTAEVAYPRTLQAQRWVEIRVAGTVGDDWVVTAATLDAPAFARVEVTARNVRLFEGGIGRVRVPLGEAMCPAGGGFATAELVLAHDGGDVVTVEVELPSEVLAEINAGECAMEAVRNVAAPSLGTADAVSGPSVDTTLTLSRGVGGHDSHVEMTALKGSVIFEVKASEAQLLPLALTAGTSSVALPITITATRCDAHAVAESKKTFVFGVWLSIDGAPEQYVEVSPASALEKDLTTVLDRCVAALDAQTPGGA